MNGPTTNAHDLAEAAKIKARLAAQSETTTSASASADGSKDGADSFLSVPNVSIDEGAHKYVLIGARHPQSGQHQHFVVSKHGAPYHRDAAEPAIERLEKSGYSEIDVKGGGRILLDSHQQKVSIFGFSYGFGRADHAVSQSVVEADERYKDYEVTTSNEGY